MKMRMIPYKLTSRFLRKFVLLVPVIWFVIVVTLLFTHKTDNVVLLERRIAEEGKEYQIAHEHDGKIAMHVPRQGEVQYFYKPDMGMDNMRKDNVPHEAHEEQITKRINKRRNHQNKWDWDFDAGRQPKRPQDFIPQNKPDNGFKFHNIGNLFDKRDIIKHDKEDPDGKNEVKYDDKEDDDHSQENEVLPVQNVHKDVQLEQQQYIEAIDDDEEPNVLDHKVEEEKLEEIKAPVKMMIEAEERAIDKDVQLDQQQYIEAIDDDEEPEVLDHKVKEEKLEEIKAPVKMMVEAEERTIDKDGPHIKWPHVPLTGLGEDGAATKLKPKTASEEKEKTSGRKKHDFNLFVSDRISVRRSLKDFRLPACQNISYPDNMPDTSVVIIFHNEAWTTLLRTVHSVLDRSPPHLLKEIILVDDHSDYGYLKRPLDAYMAQYEKVRVVHTKNREGLIRARLAGVERARAETVTFLDSHCECTTGWLEPLLGRIAENRSHVVTPVIDVINNNDFRYQGTQVKAATVSVGTFTWRMSFTWGRMSKADKAAVKADTDPARSPTMAGGLFSIHREYFYHIGLYDMGMEIWGAENVELSFRIWMCGGTLEVMPCSRVGHIFRGKNPNLAGIKGSPVHKNTLRLVETWLGEYKYIYYKSGAVSSQKTYGDISERLALKEKLQCKSFTWYMENVVPDRFHPGKALKTGMIQNTEAKKCIHQRMKFGDTKRKEPHMNMCKVLYNSIFYRTAVDELRDIDNCLDYSESNKQITFYKCHNGRGNQRWLLTEDHHLKHPASGLCLTVRNADKLQMRPCKNVTGQHWAWLDAKL